MQLRRRQPSSRARRIRRRRCAAAAGSTRSTGAATGPGSRRASRAGDTGRIYINVISRSWADLHKHRFTKLPKHAPPAKDTPAAFRYRGIVRTYVSAGARPGVVSHKIRYVIPAGHSPNRCTSGPPGPFSLPNRLRPFCRGGGQRRRWAALGHKKPDPTFRWRASPRSRAGSQKQLAVIRG